MKKFLPCSLATLLLLLTAGCGVNHSASSTRQLTSNGIASKKLSVLYAGSMTKVMEEKIRPVADQKLGLDFQGEGKGSVALAQMIHSGMSHPDVFISASPGVNNRLLMGTQNHNIVTWYVALAQDQLVIAYSPNSTFKHSLEAASKGQIPWYHVMESSGFRLGRTDPLLDPKGASTIFMFKLASQYYHQSNLEQRILGSDENTSQVFPEESLLAQLTSGQMDAIIAYKHEAIEWGVPYIPLPDAINLGNAKDAKNYAKATFRGKDGKVETGAPILFTITIPDTASNKIGAEKFVQYMLFGAGHDMLMKDGFTSIQARLTGSESAVPLRLRRHIQGTMN